MSLSLEPSPEVQRTWSGTQAGAIAVSVIVPVTERCDDLVALYKAHAEVLKRMGRSFEFLFVLDEAFVNAEQPLKHLQTLGEPIKVLPLTRPCGEAMALTIGFEHARGTVLLTLPAYFQLDAEAVQQVLTRLDTGEDLVATRRHPRKDSWLNRLQNYYFNLLVRSLTGVEFHDLGSGLRGLQRRVASETHLYGDLHRFLPLLAHRQGFRVGEVAVPQHPLDRGIRVYRPGIYLRRLLDILTVVFLFKFTQKPLRFFGLIAAALFSAGVLLAGFLAAERILGGAALSDRPLLLLSVLLMVLGVQVGSIGLIGELIIFIHTVKTKHYRIDRVLIRRT